MSHASQKIKVHAVLVSDGPGAEGVYSYASLLPVGCIISYAKSYKDGSLRDRFDFVTLINRTQSEFDNYIADMATHKNDISIWIISSYVWNHECNLELARKIKKCMPGAIVVAGGPHIPAYEQDAQQFFQDHSEIDIAIRGEGEIAFAEALDSISENSGLSPFNGLDKITGITFRRDEKTFRTADRVRNQNMDIYPSSYLTGELNDSSFDDLKGMMLETNRGCPFGCTFCDWGSATLQKFSLFDLERVKKEIDFIASKRARAIYLTDSNFGAFERDIEIAQYIADTKKKTGYPITFGSSFAKNASERLAKITRILHEAKLKSTGMISIQTTDDKVLTTINRANIRQDKHERLIQIFREEKMTLSSELMIGLPGQTVESHKNDLQYFFDRKLMTSAFCTQIMPNAPMNEPEYKKKNKIIADEEGFIISTSTFNEEDYRLMIKTYLAFQFFYVLGALKYFLYYLQLEHSIKAMDFVLALLKATRDDAGHYPIGNKLERVLLDSVDSKLKGLPTLRWNTDDSAFLFNHIDNYHKEIINFLHSHYGIQLPDDELQTILAVQKAVMPAIGKDVPLNIPLEHNFVAYFDQIKKAASLSIKPEKFHPLASFPPGTLTVKARMKKTINNLNLLRLDLHVQKGWELKSALRF